MLCTDGNTDIFIVRDTSGYKLGSTTQLCKGNCNVRGKGATVYCTAAELKTCKAETSRLINTCPGALFLGNGDGSFAAPRCDKGSHEWHVGDHAGRHALNGTRA